MKSSFGATLAAAVEERLSSLDLMPYGSDPSSATTTGESQIYVTRPQACPAMAEVIAARRRGEAAVRESGASYVIVRPGWLHDGPARGTRVEQGTR